MQGRRLKKQHTWDLIVDSNGLDPDEGNDTVCVACALPIFNTPFTIFKNDVVDNHGIGNGDGSSDGRPYLLHEHCANLPPVLTPPSHPSSPLTLIEKLVLPGKIFCGNCKYECKGFIYTCLASPCGFVLDVLCAMPIGAFKIRHQSDPHELVPILGEMLFTCGACGVKHDDQKEEGSRTVAESYYCNICCFWIHRDCALLPNTIRHKEHANDTDQQHFLCLSYTKHPIDIWDDKKCQICLEGWKSARGYYICTRCEYIAHIKCATSNPANFISVLRKDVVRGLPHLPMADEHRSVVTCVVDFIEKEPCKRGEMKMFSEIHDHPLMFVDGYSYFTNQQHHLCNGCIEPITPPLYKCLECSDFFLHPYCADLPKLSNRQHQCTDSHPPPLRISTPSILISGEAHQDFFSAFFRCKGCRKFSNGFFYYCEVCKLTYDVGCSFLPVSFTHEFHIKSHIFTFWKFRYASTFCDLCLNLAFGDSYKCISCLNFDMDTSCARLPMTVAHKFDRHPLKLITSPSTFSSTNQDEKFCEICEEDVDITICFYGCVECNQLFHVDCIPSVGGLFCKVKFGGTIQVECHECPLTCFRLLTSYSYTCGLCNKTIQGREDGIGFECTKCGYWLHLECAEDERILRLS